MKIIFCDGNKDLVELVKAKGVEAVHNDYFQEAAKHKRVVMMTASNPKWTFGGGIDAAFYRHFKFLCEKKRRKGGGNERLDNICFTITVDNQIKATEESVKSAIDFALANTKDDETLLVPGLGTGIGGLEWEKFAKIIKEKSLTPAREEGSSLSLGRTE